MGKMLTDKEKLEEELTLLKESLDLKVITEEEYLTAKLRIDSRIIELSEPKQDNKQEEPQVDGQKPEDKKEEQKIEIKEIKSEQIAQKEPVKEEESHEPLKEEISKEETSKEESTITHDEETEEPKEETKSSDTISINLSWLFNIFKRKEPEEDKTVEEEPPKTEDKEEKILEEKKIEEKETEDKAEEVKKETKVEEPKEEVKEEQEDIPDKETTSNKKLYVYSAILLILVIGLGFFFLSGSDDELTKDNPVNIPEGKKIKPLIACNSDDECKKEGSIGICNNPGQEDSICEYIQDIEIGLTILNSDTCFNCGTARILSILNGFYPNINVENIDIETEEGKELKEKFFITVLPAYIFNSTFIEAHNYDSLSSSFNELQGSFVMKNTVANANFYLDRNETIYKLDLIYMDNQTASVKAEENLVEFLEEFKGNVDFETHDENSDIVKELGINTFPIFLINNKVKFDGVQSADKIRENYCQLNSVTPCALGLSKSLV